MASIRVKPISLETVHQVLEKFSQGEISRRELAAWSRAYVELIADYSVDFHPPNQMELISELIQEVQSADLVINGEPVLSDTRVRVLLRRIKKKNYAH